MTNDLQRRMYEHRQRATPGFASRYALDRLVYAEEASDVADAIRREKEIKGWRRSKKVTLVESVNPGWRDLSLGS